MGTTKKPRKRYRPGSISLDALAKLAPVPRDRHELVMAGFRSALLTIERGHHPGEEDWRLLSDAINTIEALTLDMRVLDPETTKPLLDTAVEAMVAAAHRWRDKGVMRMDGAGMQAVRDVIELYDECGRGFTLHAMDQARNIAAERVRRVLAGDSDAKVIAL